MPIAFKPNNDGHRFMSFRYHIRVAVLCHTIDDLAQLRSRLHKRHHFFFAHNDSFVCTLTVHNSRLSCNATTGRFTEQSFENKRSELTPGRAGLTVRHCRLTRFSRVAGRYSYRRSFPVCSSWPWELARRFRLGSAESPQWPGKAPFHRAPKIPDRFPRGSRDRSSAAFYRAS